PHRSPPRTHLLRLRSGDPGNHGQLRRVPHRTLDTASELASAPGRRAPVSDRAQIPPEGWRALLPVSISTHPLRRTCEAADSSGDPQTSTDNGDVMPQHDQDRNHKAWTLVLASLGVFMTALDTLVVTTALPVLRDDLQTGLSNLEWTVNAYNL